MLSNNIYYEKKLPHPLIRLWERLQNDTLGLIGFYGVLIMLILCVCNPWITPHPINGILTEYILLPAAWSPDGDISFILGTNQFGQDIFSCLLIGTTYTFGSALVVSIIVTILGTIMGCLSVISRRFLSILIIHLFDILLAIPSFVLAIIMALFLGPSLQNVMLSIGLSILPRIIHSIYQAINSEINKEYVVTARLDGASPWNILCHSILPNITTIWITEFIRAFAIAILDITTFGFFGLTNELIPIEWGIMMKQASDIMHITIWPLLFPGIALIISIILINLLGNGLNRALEIGDE